MLNSYFSCSTRSWSIFGGIAALLLQASLTNAQGSGTLPPNNPSQDQNRNWTLERSYDGNGNVVAEGKQFTDALGRPTQAQARNAATKQVFATQTVYNTGGQPVLQTLPAPINNQGFSYKDGFVTSGGTNYGPTNFEQNKANSPDAVDTSTPGTLGYYFSQQNALEPLTPITSYPYSLVEPYEGPLGGTKRAAGPGDELRMGKGREAKGRDFPLRKEFDDYIRLRPQFVPGSPQVTLEYQGLKSVSVNANGRESIVVTNKEGQAILSCLSGSQYPALPVFGFISSDATNIYDVNAPVYQDIHIPAAGAQNVKFTMGSYASNGGKIRIINLLTDQSTDYTIAPPASPGQEPELHVTLDPGFYRFVSVEGTQWSYYEAHYGNFSYTYYDDAGRVIATISPNGLPGNASQVKVPTFVTRNNYDTSSRLLSTESNDEGRSEYVYTKDGRIRFSQSALQRVTGRFSYSNYDEANRVVESGEYMPDASGVEFESHSDYGDKLTSSQLLEAEGAASIHNSHPSGSGTPNYVGAASGGQDVGWLTNQGDYVQFSLTVPQTGSYELQFGYATGATVTQTMSLLVNTQFIKHVPFAGTNDWGVFANSSRQVVTLYANRINTVQVLYDSGDNGFVDLDYLRVLPPVSSTIKQEAEAASFVNSNSNQPGYVNSASGGQDVNWLTSPGNYVRFALSAPRAGTYTLRLRYATGGNGARTMSLLVNDSPTTQLTLPGTSNWDQFTTYSTTATLRAGVNTVQLLYGPSDNGNIDIDYLEAEGGQLMALTHPLSVQDIIEDRTRTGGLNVAQCSQRNQVWYDLPFDGSSSSQGNDSQLNGRQQAFTIGAVTKTKNDNVTVWYSYDEMGRIMWVVQDVTGVGVKTLDYQYDFSGNVLTVAYQQNQADAFYHYYTYDAAQRLSKVETSPNGSTRTTQAEYSYYLHGSLKRVQIAGDLQGVDYAYTLQGALKSINHVNPTLEPGHDSPTRNGVQKDLFALTLDYFSGDYQSRALSGTPPVAGGTSVPTRYDGTIQGATWRTAASTDIHRVAYTYDEKSQLQDSQYGQWQRQAGNGSYLLNSASTSALREGGLSYDPNGNIQSLLRTDQQGNTTDNFSYSYKPNTNQLTEVHTGSQNGTTVLDYDYDELGQMTRQRDEQGQRYFTYDVTGKTIGVYLDAAHQQPVVTFAYDDRGFRVSKTGYVNGVAKTTYYVRDVAGNILAVYEKRVGGPVMDSPVEEGPATIDGPISIGGTTQSSVQRTEVPLYGTSRLGTLTRLDDGSEDYRYELNDHLGDARVVFHKPTTTTETETMELSGVSSTAAFQNNNLYRSNEAYSGSYGARLADTQPAGQELKRVLTVAKGDTITFSAWGKLKEEYDSFTGSPMQPYLMLGAATTTDELPQTSPEGQRRTAGPGRWLGRLAAGLGFSLGQRTAQQRQAQALQRLSLQGWLKYRVLDDQGRQVGTDMVYLSGTPNRWERMQIGIRVAQGGTVEVIAGTNGTGSAVYFDDLTVEQIGGLIVQEQHQYAFGAPLPGLSYTVGNRRYRYGYQGQYAEKDAETGYESFELRLYNSRIGRWASYDPEGQFSSPYVGMGNNPVSGVDPNGGFCEGCPAAFNVALTNVAVTATKATGAWAQMGLRAAGAIAQYARPLAEFGFGFATAYSNNMAMNIPNLAVGIANPRHTTILTHPPTMAFAAGALAADVISLYQGVGEVLTGIGGEVGGGGLTLTGVGAAPGVLIMAGSTGLIAHGGLTGVSALQGLWTTGNAMLNMAKASSGVSGAGGLKIRFGKDANQQNHSTRHIVEESGLDPNDVKRAVEADLQTKASKLIPGKPLNEIIIVNGKKIQYTAYELPDGTINVGRMHEVP